MQLPLGELAALGAAAVWAVGTVIFAHAGRNVPALALNLVKGVLALPLIVIAALILPTQWGQPSFEALLLFGVSGALGIGVGDTCYFAALRRIGATRTALLFMASTPIAVLLSTFALGEPINVFAILGIALTIAGILWVIAERATATDAQASRKLVAVGITFGLAAAALQAVGLILNRQAFNLATDTSEAWATVLRLACGCAALALVLSLLNNKPLADARRWPWKLIVIGMVLGTFTGLLLQQFSVKHAVNAGIAQTLLNTTPLFVLPIAPLIGERVSRRAVLGAIVAMAGVSVLLWSVT
ncbi:MAG: DMT family transporter [Planctomycetota bacterium]